MDAAHQWTHHQGIGVVKDGEITGTRALQLHGDQNKRIRPYKEQALNCPRCNSANTKFCYYNNYSLSQPRYFCKTCRRYWTDGGSLRNVPVGGGSRKNKRPSVPSSTASPASAATLPPIPLPSPKFYGQGGQDLNLCFANVQNSAHYGFVPAPESCPGFGAGFGFQELMRQSNMKLPLGDDLHGGYNGGGTMQEGGTGRLLFPFEDLSQVQMSNGGREDAQGGSMVEEGHDPSLFW